MTTANPKPIQGGSDAKTLATVAAAIAAAAQTTDAVAIPYAANCVQFVLNVTAAATAGTDTLDCKVQTELISGVWVDVVAFVQVLGDGGALVHVEKSSPALTQAGFVGGTALTAGNTRDIAGSAYRVVYDVNGGTGSFTFTVSAVPA